MSIIGGAWAPNVIWHLRGGPRRFSDPHDRKQWEKLSSLPNLIYTDGNSFSLWQDGELQGEVVHLKGDIETAGASLSAPPSLLPLISGFLQWKPIAPRTAKQLAGLSARLCRFLRDEVTEDLQRSNSALLELAKEWRSLLFPQASDDEFADGYAQAVTFGLLVARARDISLAGGIDHAALELRKSSSLISTALRLLTDDPENREALKTSLDTLTRVLEEVDWTALTKDKPEAWLYFYEDFLEVYDNDLRKRTGSYYTPAGSRGCDGFAGGWQGLAITCPSVTIEASLHISCIKHLLPIPFSSENYCIVCSSVVVLKQRETEMLATVVEIIIFQ